jgi:hypothetical protein
MMVNGDHLQETTAGIRNDTARDYSQKVYGKNVLVVLESRHATQVILGDDDSRREGRCMMVDGDHLQGSKGRWRGFGMIQCENDTVRDYIQKVYGNNILVVLESRRRGW